MSQFPFFSQQQPAYRGQAATTAQKQPPGFFDSLMSGFGLFGAQAPAYRGKVGGQLPPAPTVFRPFSVEMACPEMSEDMVYALGQPVVVPWPKGAKSYRVSFSPAYVTVLPHYGTTDEAEAKFSPQAVPARPRAIAAFPVGTTEPAHGALRAGVAEPSELRLTPHWFSAIGVRVPAESIRAVLTVLFE